MTIHAFSSQPGYDILDIIHMNHMIWSKNYTGKVQWHGLEVGWWLGGVHLVLFSTEKPRPRFRWANQRPKLHRKMRLCPVYKKFLQFFIHQCLPDSESKIITRRKTQIWSHETFQSRRFCRHRCLWKCSGKIPYQTSSSPRPWKNLKKKLANKPYFVSTDLLLVHEHKKLSTDQVLSKNCGAINRVIQSYVASLLSIVRGFLKDV